MEEYIVYIFYLAMLLLLGIIATGVANKLRLSNILLLVLIGVSINKLEFNYFNDNLILVLSGLALILITVEASMEIDMKDVFRNFFNVFKFSVLNFIVSSYILTLLIVQLFGMTSSFESFVLCLLLSIILIGVDPTIALEFFNLSKTRIKDILSIEGTLASLVVVVFSFFIMNYLHESAQVFARGMVTQAVGFAWHVLLAVLVGIFIAFLLARLLSQFPLSRELHELAIIGVALSTFAVAEFLGADGSLTTVVYCLAFKGFCNMEAPKKHTSMLAHTLYLIVFILFGTEFFFPVMHNMLKALLVFLAFLITRFLFILLFFKQNTWKERMFMTFNVAKGIEVAIVLFIMKLQFQHVEGIDLILGLGYFFFIMSYLLSTVISHFSEYFLQENIYKNEELP